MKTLFVHFGFAKTGSTSIQLFCYKNRLRLEQEGVRFLRSGLVWCIHRRYREKLSRIIDEINTTNFDTYILSEEEISFKPDTVYLSRLLAGLHDCKVILLCYIRRQDDFLESLYCEDIKNTRIADSANAYLNRLETAGGLRKIDRGDYLLTIKSYMRALNLGYEDFIVRRFSRNELYRGDAVVDFISMVCPHLHDQLSMDPVNWEELGFTPCPQLNFSKDLDYVEFKRRLNKVINRMPATESIKNKLAGWLRNILRSAPAKRSGDTRAYFNPERRQELLRHFSDINSELSRIFFDGAALFQEGDVRSVTPYPGLKGPQYLRILWYYVKAGARALRPAAK